MDINDQSTDVIRYDQIISTGECRVSNIAYDERTQFHQNKNKNENNSVIHAVLIHY